MPSAKVLEQKQAQVAELKTLLEGAVAGVLVDYKGITVTNDTKLRKELREAGVKYVVAKNTLLSFAADQADISGLKEYFSGTTAIAISNDDYVVAAKILQPYAEDKKTTFNIKAGFIDGEIIDTSKVETLAKLPSRDVLVSQVLGGLNAPITGFVYVLQANITGLARVLGAIAEKQGA